MGGSTALKLAFEIPDSIDKILLLSPAGLFGEPKSIPFPLNQIGASFLGLPQVRKSLSRQAFAFPDECVGEMEEQIASIHLGCKGWRIHSHHLQKVEVLLGHINIYKISQLKQYVEKMIVFLEKKRLKILEKLKN